MALSSTEKQRLALKASQVFTPAAPIRKKDVFAGRTDQLRSVIDAIHQPGQHALIFGERGVGKTSLAYVLADFVELTGQGEIIAPHVNCDATDEFSTIWHKVFKQIPLIEERAGFGFKAETQKIVSRLSDRAPEEFTPETILSIALSLTRQNVFIPIIDEFDRLQSETVPRHLTDTIKALSDHSAHTTVILVGVADTVEELIAEHQSIERALVQVRMPRMSQQELMEIITHGISSLQMTLEESAGHYIASLSQGLPHYTHLLGLHSSRNAIDNGETHVQLQHVDGAVKKAIEGAQQTLRRAYHKATISQRSDALYPQVLLACAMARTDQLGYFAAVDVRDPMSRIMHKRYEIAAFSRHLADFCEEDRGPVLERTGVPRRYRFRFRNPLLQPFVLMQGLAAGLIDRQDINKFEKT